MLFSFQIETEELHKWYAIYVNDGDREYKLMARQGHTRHLYMNIPVSRKPTVKIPIPASYSELSYSYAPFISKEQEQLNRGLVNNGTTPFKRVIRGTPKHMVVTLPHFKGQGGWPAPYAVLDGSKLDLDNCLYLSFQDPYFHLGSYLLSDNQGHDPKPGIVATIRDELSLYGISEESLTILGASKGASAALMISEYFTANQLIVCSLSTDLDFPIRKSQYSHIGVALDYYGVKYPNTMELLLSEAATKDTHWFYAVGDDSANRGNETKSAARLSKYPCEVDHAQVVSTNYGRISEIIATRQLH